MTCIDFLYVKNEFSYQKGDSLFYSKRSSLVFLIAVLGTIYNCLDFVSYISFGSIRFGMYLLTGEALIL